MSLKEQKTHQTRFWLPLELRPQKRKQDKAYWEKILHNSSLQGVPLPSPAKRIRKSALDDISIFLNEREKKRERTRRIAESGIPECNTRDITTPFGSPVVTREPTTRDASTMTTFETPFLQSLRAKVQEEEVNFQKDISLVQTESCDEPRVEMDNFMREAFARTTERNKSSISPPEKKTVAPLRIPSTSEVGTLSQIKSSSAPKNVGPNKNRQSAVSKMINEVTTSLEVKDRPYVRSLLDNVVSHRSKWVHRLLHGDNLDNMSANAPSENAGVACSIKKTSTMIEEILKKSEKRNKRKNNVICGVDVTKHPQPTIASESSEMTHFVFPFGGDDDVLIPTPREPKPISPESKRLRKQLRLGEPVDGQTKAKPLLSSSIRNGFGLPKFCQAM